MDDDVVHASASEFDTVFKVSPFLGWILEVGQGIMGHVSEDEALEASEWSVVWLQEWHDSCLLSTTSLERREVVDQLKVCVLSIALHGSTCLEERKLVPLRLSVIVLLLSCHIEDHAS